MGLGGFVPVSILVHSLCFIEQQIYFYKFIGLLGYLVYGYQLEFCCVEIWVVHFFLKKDER